MYLPTAHHWWWFYISKVFHDILLSPSEVEARPEALLESAAEDPAPVVGRPLRSRGKSSAATTPSSSRTSSSHHHTVGQRFNKARPCILPSCQYRYIVCALMVSMFSFGQYRKKSVGKSCFEGPLVVWMCSCRSTQSRTESSPGSFTLLVNTVPPGGEDHSRRGTCQSKGGRRSGGNTPHWPHQSNRDKVGLLWPFRKPVAAFIR